MRTSEMKYLSALAGALLVLGVVASPSGADPLREGTSALISRYPDGSQGEGGYPSVSADGRYVAFESWSALLPEDTDSDTNIFTDNNSDIYRYDRLTGEILLVSVNYPSVSFASACNYRPSISGDGSKVAYRSGALFGGSEYGDRACYAGHVVVRDIPSTTSKAIPGTYGGWTTQGMKMSRDARYVAVIRSDGFDDHFAAVIDVASGSLRWESPVVCVECLTAIMDDSISISGNGRFVAYDARAGQYAGDPIVLWGTYLVDRDTNNNGVFDDSGNSLTNVAILPSGAQVRWSRSNAVSDDGKLVAFISANTNTMQDNTFKYYLRNLTVGTTEILSQSSIGVPGAGADPRFNWPVGISPSISADGRYVAFSTMDPYLAPGDTKPTLDVFVRDRLTGKTHLASALPGGDQDYLDAVAPALSADGNYLAFDTQLAPYQIHNNYFRSGYLREVWTPCSIACLPNPSL
ncbi:MAG TPA: hypothetical protein VI541_03920 [Actinomycetota bacterium]|nr:hypothetical protein [Actinomycetota bacterium]